MKVQLIEKDVLHFGFLFKGLSYIPRLYSAQYKDIVSIGQTALEAINTCLERIH